MSEKKSWKLLARYLSNECSKDEKEKVEKWVMTDPENQRLMKFMKAIWNTPEIQPQESDIKKLWLEVAEKAGITPRVVDTNIETTPKPIAERKKIWVLTSLGYSRVFAYAAILLLIISLPFVIWRISKIYSPGQQAFELEKIVVDVGLKKNLILNDGTHITLDAGSIFHYPQEFKKKAREVFLNGEGYFEVTPDAEKPFIVYANHAVIRVLGTKFNVRAWQHNQRVEVVVAEGKVTLRSKKVTPGEEVVIYEGKMSILPKQGHPYKPRSVDVEKHFAWVNREVTFENAPLHEILYQLERWYGIQFILMDESFASDHLTVHIQNLPIEDILELITTLTELEYERTDNIFILKSKEINEGL